MAYQQRFVIEKTVEGNIKGGKSVREAIDELKPGRHVVTITKYVKHRSMAQNNLIHLYFGIIADETGNELQIVKDILKKEFLTTEVLDDDGNIKCNPATGEPLTYVMDTSSLNTISMAEFTEKVRMWAMDDWGIILPLPEDQFKLNV